MTYSNKTTLALTAVVALSCLACSPKINHQDNQTTPPADNTASTTVVSGELAAADKVPVNEFGLAPFSDVKAPTITKSEPVRMTTDAGELLIEVYPEAAPNAAQRFLELVGKGFYDETPIFRVVNNPQPFVAQFGINWRPVMLQYKESTFNDDPSYFRLLPGTLAFAKAGPNTNSTQVFINFADNSPLRSQGFTTFARITKGMECLKNFKAVGDPSMGLDQEALWFNGEAYLKSLDDKPTMIQKAVLVNRENASEPTAPSGQAPTAPAK